MHLVQAKTLLPEAKRTHCKLGFFLFLTVGLYFPRSFFNRQTIIDDLPQIEHCLAIIFTSYQRLRFLQGSNIMYNLNIWELRWNLNFSYTS